MANSSLSKSIAALDQKVSISAGSEPKVLDDHNLGPTKSPTFDHVHLTNNLVIDTTGKGECYESKG